MDMARPLMMNIQDLTSVIIAVALIVSILIAVYKSVQSARLLTRGAAGTADRLARIEKSLDALIGGGSLSEGSITSGSLELEVQKFEALPERQSPEENSTELDSAHDRSRGYKIAEPPAKAARRLLSTAIEKAGSELTVEKALDLFRTISDQQNRVDERTNLREVSEQQLSSTASTKTSMIWLFLAFNLAIIFGLIFSSTSFINAKELILGLYISMAMFIVYVFRSSNARALTLLSITEDLKRYHDAEKYMNNLRPGAEPTERDVEILKLILTNRAEREKNAEHPYEMVLKGITNSTVLLKGGKVATTSRAAKDQ